MRPKPLIPRETGMVTRKEEQERVKDESSVAESAKGFEMRSSRLDLVHADDDALMASHRIGSSTNLVLVPHRHEIVFIEPIKRASSISCDHVLCLRLLAIKTRLARGTHSSHF